MSTTLIPIIALLPTATAPQLSVGNSSATETQAFFINPSNLQGSNTERGGLSSGAKIGIAVAVSLTVLLAAAGGFITWWCRRRARAAAAGTTNTVTEGGTVLAGGLVRCVSGVGEPPMYNHGKSTRDRIMSQRRL